jgi:hypothetical protein
MGKLIESNVPMWEIDGNDKLSRYASAIAELSFEIKKAEHEMVQLNQEIESSHQRINMYIGNVLGIQDYEHLENVLVVNEQFQISIYPTEVFEQANGNADALPETDQTYTINKKLVQKIVDMLFGYNDLIDAFDELNAEYTDALKEHKQSWVDVKKIVQNINYLQLHTQEPSTDVEGFDDEKHTLIIVQNKQGEWGFRYIRKEDEKAFNEFIHSQLNPENITDDIEDLEEDDEE